MGKIEIGGEPARNPQTLKTPPAAQNEALFSESKIRRDSLDSSRRGTSMHGAFKQPAPPNPITVFRAALYGTTWSQRFSPSFWKKDIPQARNDIIRRQESDVNYKISDSISSKVKNNVKYSDKEMKNHENISRLNLPIYIECIVNAPNSQSTQDHQAFTRGISELDYRKIAEFQFHFSALPRSTQQAITSDFNDASKKASLSSGNLANLPPVYSTPVIDHENIINKTIQNIVFAPEKKSNADAFCRFSESQQTMILKYLPLDKKATLEKTIQGDSNKTLSE